MRASGNTFHHLPGSISTSLDHTTFPMCVWKESSVPYVREETDDIGQGRCCWQQQSIQKYRTVMKPRTVPPQKSCPSSSRCCKRRTKQRNDQTWRRITRCGSASVRLLIIPLEGPSCVMIALAANAQSKGAKVPMSVAPFESEYAVTKTGLEYVHNIHPFPAAVE